MFCILVAEDNINTARLFETVLSYEGYNVFLASDGEEALEIMDRQHIDLIVLDVMMPKMDGYAFTEALRDGGCTTPVLMVTAKQLPEDKIRGFRAGTDDYMVKPVNEEEMLLRIKALLRRAKIADERRIVIGDVILDYDSLTVSKNDEVHTLPKKEFYLLYKLLSYPNMIFTRLQLMDEIWGMDSQSGDSTLNVHINRLRKRFGDWHEFEIIAVRGIGYKAVIYGEHK